MDFSSNKNFEYFYDYPTCVFFLTQKVCHLEVEQIKTVICFHSLKYLSKFIKSLDLAISLTKN